MTRILAFFILALSGAFGEEVSRCPTTFYLVRHGQTDWNLQGKMQGHTDIPLNDAGRMQAFQLSQALGDTAFAACFASDLQRAKETAQILIGSRCMEVRTDARLRERNFGEWEGRSSSEWVAFLKQAEPLVGVESNEAMEKRIFSFLKTICCTYPGSNILIVTHGGVMKNLVSKLLSRDLSEIQIKNAALLQLEVTDEYYRIRGMSGIFFQCKKESLQ